MPICPNCSAQVPDEAAFCEHCATRVAPIGAALPVTQGAGRVQSSRQVGAQPLPEIGDLIVVSGPGGSYGTRFGLTQARQRIGRGPSAHVSLADPAVSREHALIWFQDGFFYLQDQASASGTYVAGRRVVREPLRDGDEIQIGNTLLVLRVVPHKPRW
jgi:FHA domain/zinc-ribbon domain